MSRCPGRERNLSFKADAVHFGYYTQGHVRATLTPTLGFAHGNL
jgi:hypothetical protein